MHTTGNIQHYRWSLASVLLNLVQQIRASVGGHTTESLSHVQTSYSSTRHMQQRLLYFDSVSDCLFHCPNVPCQWQRVFSRDVQNTFFISVRSRSRFFEKKNSDSVRNEFGSVKNAVRFGYYSYLRLM